MLKYESYSFSRLFLNQNIEFFFIAGINGTDNFDEYWDGRSVEVIGYAVIYISPEISERKNYIYLINKDNSDYNNAIRYTKKFIEEMFLLDENFDIENFEVINTEIKIKVVTEPYEDFVKMVIKNEIPGSVLDKLF